MQAEYEEMENKMKEKVNKRRMHERETLRENKEFMLTWEQTGIKNWKASRKQIAKLKEKRYTDSLTAADRVKNNMLK